MAFHESSSSLDASKTPSSPTPICVTCLKELGAGDEIMERETERDFDLLAGRFQFDLVLLIFLDWSDRGRRRLAKT